MNIIDYSLNEVIRRIPPQILTKVSATTDPFGMKTTSIEYIRDNVLNCRVLVDVNIIGGRQIMVSTDAASNVMQLENTTLYTFPESAFQGNRLVAVTDFGSQFVGVGCCGTGCDTYTGSEYCGENEGIYGRANQYAKQMVAGQTVRSVGGSIYHRKVGSNSIALLFTETIQQGWFTVIVSHDEHLADMDPRTGTYVADMLTEATKAMIYNDHVLTLGQADASRGYVLNDISDVIRGYSDAEEKYQELRNGYGAVAFANDPERIGELIDSSFGYLDGL